MGTSIITYLKNRSKNKQPKQAQEIKSYINQINKAADGIFTLAEPLVYTLAKENNIACKFKNDYIVTKDGNLTIGFEFLGASYAGVSLEEEMAFLQSRIAFFNELKNDVEIVFVTKKSEFIANQNLNSGSKNIYANEICQKWQNNQKVYSIKYFMFISTVNKNITGFLESFKTKATTEQSNLNNENFAFNAKLKILEELSNEVKAKLDAFRPKKLNGDEIINFYATYSNASETNLRYSHELITDSYINSDVNFKKDYIEFYRNDGKTIYARFISIKAYETEAIKSIITTNTLQNKNEFMVFVYLKAYEKEKAIKKIKDTRAFAPNVVREELDELMELIKADRENLIEVSYSMYLFDESLDNLENKTNELKNLLANQGLNVVRETLNQKALYFSFFPSRGNLNARKKTLKTSNLSTIINFENEPTGFNENDWGNEAVTTFKHLNGSPFLFNFHCQPGGDRPSGHTMIIGGTGSGKTSLAQFLMCNLYKYDIDIFAMDKLHGMYNFAIFTDGEYHDSDAAKNDVSRFRLNPFSLPNTPENVAFLNSWLAFMAQVGDDEHNAKGEINQTVERLFKTRDKEKEENNRDIVITLDNLIESLPANDETNLKIRFSNFKDSIFNNDEDALNFDKQLSILNMDGILQDHKISSLAAMYIFHKLKNQAKNNTSKRGFFCFIDELKDYLNDVTMREKILEAILEVRKIGGVMCMGFQNIGLFKDIDKGSSFLDNIANFIIFPTTNEQTIKELIEMVGLTPSEAKFLSNTNPNSRKILLKMKLRNESAILDVDLSRLNRHLRVFSSSSDNVNLMKKLMSDYPAEFRELYLQGKE